MRNVRRLVEAEAMLAGTKARYLATLDANDVIYAFDASRNYNPEPEIEKIVAPTVAINSQDDEVNPPELNLMEPVIKKMRKGRYILIPTSDKTSGHGTHSNPLMWVGYLKELLESSGKQH